jgi:hypothetical protein
MTAFSAVQNTTRNFRDEFPLIRGLLYCHYAKNPQSLGQKKKRTPCHILCPNSLNPLKAKRVCFIQGLSAYRAVNTLHFGYKNQSLNVL